MSAADAVEDDLQRLGELDVAQPGGDRGVAVDAGGLEGLPVDEDVGAGDVAEEVDDVGEADAVEVHLGELAVELGLDGPVLAVLAALLRRRSGRGWR